MNAWMVLSPNWLDNEGQIKKQQAWSKPRHVTKLLALFYKKEAFAKVRGQKCQNSLLCKKASLKLRLLKCVQKNVSEVPAKVWFKVCAYKRVMLKT